MTVKSIWKLQKWGVSWTTSAGYSVRLQQIQSRYCILCICNIFIVFHSHCTRWFSKTLQWSLLVWLWRTGLCFFQHFVKDPWRGNLGSKSSRLKRQFPLFPFSFNIIFRVWGLYFPSNLCSTLIFASYFPLIYACILSVLIDLLGGLLVRKLETLHIMLSYRLFFHLLSSVRKIKPKIKLKSVIIFHNLTWPLYKWIWN